MTQRDVSLEGAKTQSRVIARKSSYVIEEMKKLFILLVLSILLFLASNAQEKLTFKYKLFTQFDQNLCHDSSLHIHGLDSNFNYKLLTDTLKLISVHYAIGYYKSDSNMVAFKKYGSISKTNLYVSCLSFKPNTGTGHITIYGTKKGQSTFMKYKKGYLFETWVLSNDYILHLFKFDPQERYHGEITHNNYKTKIQTREKYRHGKLVKTTTHIIKEN